MLRTPRAPLVIGVLVTLALAMFLGVRSARAQDAVVYDSISSWESAVDAPTLETFDSPETADPIGLGYEMSSGSVVGGTYGVGQDVVLSITFNVPGTTQASTVFGSGFELYNLGLYDVRAYDATGAEVAAALQVAGAEQPGSGFVGFTYPEGIARVEIDHTTIGGVSIDNLRIAQNPATDPQLPPEPLELSAFTTGHFIEEDPLVEGEVSDEPATPLVVDVATEGVPVVGADVSVGNVFFGHTGDDGRVAGRFPLINLLPGRVIATVTAEQGDQSGQASVLLHEIIDHGSCDKVPRRGAGGLLQFIVPHGSEAVQIAQLISELIGTTGDFVSATITVRVSILEARAPGVVPAFRVQIAELNDEGNILESIAYWTEGDSVLELIETQAVHPGLPIYECGVQA